MDVSRISKLIKFPDKRLAIVLAGCALTPPFAHSFELSAALNSDLEYTSNAASSSSNTQEDLIESLGFNIGIVETRKRVRADADINVNYTRYENETYSDELSLTSGFGLFSIDLVEDFLNWQATFTRTDVLSDTSEDDNPENREYRNIFRTGPTITYAISRTMNLSFAANYVNLDNSEETAVDSERADGRFRLNYQYNSLTDFSLGIQHDEVVDSDDGEDIKSTNFNGGFTRQITDGVVRFNYGVQNVESNQDIDDSDETDSNYFDVSLTRNRLWGQNVELSYQEEITDTAIGFESDESGQADENDRTNGVSETDLEKRKRVRFSASREFSSFSYDFSAIYQESEFERSGAKERFRNVVLGIQPNLYSRLLPRIEHRYSRENFSRKSDGEDVTRSYRLSARYEAIKDLFLNAFMEFEIVDNDENSRRESEEFITGVSVSLELF